MGQHETAGNAIQPQELSYHLNELSPDDLLRTFREAVAIGEARVQQAPTRLHFYLVYDVMTGQRCATCFVPTWGQGYRRGGFPILLPKVCPPCHDREQEVRSHE